MKSRIVAFIAGVIVATSFTIVAQDWYEASGIPAQRSQLNSAEFRSEFAAIENDIAAKLPALTGNGNKLIAVNSGGTALTALSTGITVAQGGTGATTLTGILQGNGTSAVTGISNSSTVGQTLRVTAASTYAWGALDLADGDAITGDIPDANLSANVALEDTANVFSVTQEIQNNDPILILDEADGNNASYVRFEDNATIRGYVGSINGADALCGAGSVQGDFCIRIQSGRLIVSSDGATSFGDITPSSGTFTASFDTACTTTPTITFDYQRIGNIVAFSQVAQSGFPCTGDSTQFLTAAGDVPAALRPAATCTGGLSSGYTDNGADFTTMPQIFPGGNVNFSGTWTAAGSRNVSGALTLVCMLGNP